MLLTDDEEAANLARKWSTQSREPSPWYTHNTIGLNYRQSNVIAYGIKDGSPKGEKLLQVDLKQTKIRKTVKLTRSLNFNLVCTIGNGKYKGWYILTRGRWTYYYNPKQ